VKRPMRIAIDGPAGAGKSTVARLVAEALGLPRLDTGAMYRALTYLALASGVAPEDEEGLVTLLGSQPIRPCEGGVAVGERVLREELRTPAVERAVSVVAAHGRVRAAMVRRQRELAGGGAVVDGRDIGTRVLPDADLKVFLTASLEERVRRRLAQLAAEGRRAEEDAVRREIEERDRRDTSRAVDPLTVAEDAVVIDTTGLSAAEVVARILALVEERRP
jgi:cytidylate kinase